MENNGYPEEGELVLGTVDNIFKQGAFIKLEEYKGKSGMLHLSEISLKWVRNIRDYVKEGQKVVLVVLKVNQSRGHIDLSLRRVSDQQRKHKLTEVKQKQRAEKLLSLLAKELKVSEPEVQEKVGSQLSSIFGGSYIGLEALVINPDEANKLEIPPKWKEKLLELVEGNIKSPFVEITGFLEVKSYAPNGVEIVKNALAEIDKQKGEAELDVSYVSAPIYRIHTKATDYKKAERALKTSAEAAVKYIEKNKGDAIFHRELDKK